MFRIREQTSQIIRVGREKKNNLLILSLTYPHFHTYTRVSARSPLQAICAVDWASCAGTIQVGLSFLQESN